MEGFWHWMAKTLSRTRSTRSEALRTLIYLDQQSPLRRKLLNQTNSFGDVFYESAEFQSSPSQITACFVTSCDRLCREAFDPCVADLTIGKESRNGAVQRAKKERKGAKGRNVSANVSQERDKLIGRAAPEHTKYCFFLNFLLKCFLY